MTIIPLYSLRRIIPRWRDTYTALRTGELLFSLRLKPKTKIGDDLFQEKLQNWRSNREIEFAAEVVSSAISLGNYEEAIDAAEFLELNSRDTTKSVLSIANEILIRTGNRPKIENNNDLGDFDKKILHNQIHKIRQNLADYPRNTFLWADLSLFYSKLGQVNKSIESMNVALNLAPTNRFILRSASRLYIHVGEPDRAHDLLISKTETRYDPWLLAAEIATACVANRTSKLIRRSKDLLESRTYSDFQTAELASAIATLELSNGAAKKARRLFQLSLLDPTENSVAQSVWAKKALPVLEINDVIIRVPRAYEARAIQALNDQDWEVAVEESIRWLKDEFFSSRPAEVGAYAALIGMENYPLAEKIIWPALIANPDDLILINNLAFSIANQKGREYEAYSILQSAIQHIENARDNIPIKATMGLINLRLGKLDEGQKLYLEAISLAKKRSNLEQATIATMYYAREMILAGLFTKTEAIDVAENAAKSINHPHTNILLEKIIKVINQ